MNSKEYKKKVQELRVELYPTDEDIKKCIAERVAAGEKKATYIKGRPKRPSFLCVSYPWGNFPMSVGIAQLPHDFVTKK